MKQIFCILCILSSLMCWAKNENTPPKYISLDTVIQMQGVEKSKIYDGVKIWFAKNMKSSNNVIQLDDKENTHIIGKASLPFAVAGSFFGNYSHLSGYIQYLIDIQARDGRFRLKMSEYYHVSYTDGWTEGWVYTEGIPEAHRGIGANQYNQMRKRAIPLILYDMTHTVITIQKSITEQTSESKDNDW